MTGAALHQQIVEDSYKSPITVLISAKNCPPCKTLKPKLYSLADQKNFRLVELDAMSNKDFCMHFGIRTAPTVLVINRGTVTTTFTGDRSSDELLSAISRAGGLQQGLL